MANLEGMKNKYIVLKRGDAVDALQSEDALREGFKLALYKVALHREKQGKNTEHKYLVINTDEPYVDEVIEIMKRHGHWG